MNKVWSFNRNYDVVDEVYENTVEATNRAKELSLRGKFSIVQNQNGKVFFFEYGEVVSVKRKQELAKEAEEVLIGRMEKDVSQARGKRYSKKQ